MKWYWVYVIKSGYSDVYVYISMLIGIIVFFFKLIDCFDVRILLKLVVFWNLFVDIWYFKK